eukprot:scaffold215_cov423-Prasinococcus_capsulatus_cf.AAC.11
MGDVPSRLANVVSFHSFRMDHAARNAQQSGVARSLAKATSVAASVLRAAYEWGEQATAPFFRVHTLAAQGAPRPPTVSTAPCIQISTAWVQPQNRA